MTAYEIFSKRRQTKRFDKERVPDQVLIEKLLTQTFNIVPSKQNLVPYKIHILGPEDKETRKKFWEITTSTYAHQLDLFSPYLLIFTNRLAEPNDYVQKKLNNGCNFDAVNPEKYDKYYQKIESGIEVGMFAAIFTSLCIDEGLGVSYLRCFPDWGIDNIDKDHWADLKFIDAPPLLTMQVGYPGMTVFLDGENKPDISKVLNWVDDELSSDEQTT